MKHKTQSKVAKQPTNTDLQKQPPLTAAQVAEALKAIGHDISRQQVAKDIARGADTTSAEAYLAWKNANELRATRKLPGNAGLAALREAKITEEIAVLKLRKQLDEKKLAEMEGRLVDVNAVHAAQDRCCAKAMAILQQKFETELPPKQDGLPAEKIEAMNREALDEVRAILSKRETYQS